jgi:hypothetical protein
MNRWLSTFACFFLFISLMAAQNADYVNRGGLGFVKFGLGFSSPNDLNDDLTKTFNSNTEISSTSFQIGAGGLLLVSKRLLFALEGSGYFNGTEEVGAYSAKLTGGSGELKVGIPLLNNNKFLGFPYLGIGAGGSRLEITNDAIEDVFFGETKVPEFSEERLRTTYPILDLGVSIFKIPAPDTDGVSIGAHLGFRTALGKDTWKMDNDDDVVGTSDFGASGFYLKLSIGGGGFFYKKKRQKENP